jgi:hypothetical protein
MTDEEKLEKARTDFCSLREEQQDYILGMLQALVYANDEFEPVVDAVQSIQGGIKNER